MAFSRLENLALCLVTYGQEIMSNAELFENLPGLRSLLASMVELKHLELSLSAGYGDPPKFYTYDQVFPKDKRWDNLESFSLREFSIKATDLVHLLQHRIPKLNELAIGEIRLLEGAWEDVFECLRQSHQLSKFTIDYDMYSSTKAFGKMSNTRLYDDLEAYVVNGGRHPCLADEQPNSAAHAFLADMLRFSNSSLTTYLALYL